MLCDPGKEEMGMIVNHSPPLACSTPPWDVPIFSHLASAAELRECTLIVYGKAYGIPPEVQTPCMPCLSLDLSHVLSKVRTREMGRHLGTHPASVETLANHPQLTNH